MDALKMADAIVGASSATAGLLLVFLGSVTSSYELYRPTDKKAVRKKYQERGLVAWLGLIIAFASAVLGLLAQWMTAANLAVAAFLLLTVSLLFVLYAAYLSLSEIK